MFGPEGVVGLWKENRDRAETEFWDKLDNSETREGLPVEMWRLLPPSPTSEVLSRVRLLDGTEGVARIYRKDLPPGWTPQTVIDISDGQFTYDE